MMRPHHTKDVLITTEQIQQRIDEMVDQMESDCRADKFVIIGIMRGSFIFLADLVRALYHHGVHPQIDFMTLESYGSGTESNREVQIRKDISLDVQGADVILVDDILDTGFTMTFAREHMKSKGASSIKICTCLDKPSRREVPIEAEYVGFTIEDRFVVGYGLDYDSHYRELPYISLVTFLDEAEE